MSRKQHIEASKDIRARCAVITLSDTRTEATDQSGARIRQLLAEHGHEVAIYRLIRDEPADLDALLNELEDRSDIDAILTNGGTGISPRDQTIPTIERHLSAVLSGFGELLRMLSFEQIKSGAMLSRATAGVAGGKVLFAMPGSTAAVELAMTQLVLPELKHLVWELRKP